MTTFELLAFIIICFATGYIFRSWIKAAADLKFDNYTCDNCRLQIKLPKYARWELRHTCDSRHNETFLAQRKIPDIIEPKEEKVPGEGKILC